MTFQFKDIASKNTSARHGATNRTMVLLAQRLGVLLALQFKETAADSAAIRRQPTNHTLVLLAMCLGVLVAQIDTSVVNLATHAIGQTFQAGVAPLQWVLDAYNLVYAVLLLSGGLVADLYGRRRAFAIGAAVMAMGSLLCASAPAIGILIAGRAITGIGAALLLPSSLAIIRVVWPEPAARTHAGNLGQLQRARLRYRSEHRRVPDRAFWLAQRLPAGGAAGGRRVCARLGGGSGIRRSERPSFRPARPIVRRAGAGRPRAGCDHEPRRRP
jgi:hypothetical protein